VLLACLAGFFSVASSSMISLILCFDSTSSHRSDHHPHIINITADMKCTVTRSSATTKEPRTCTMSVVILSQQDYWGYCVVLFAWSKFSHSDTIPACNRQRQTCDNSIHHASIVHVVKMDENHFPKVAILHYQGEYLNLLLRSHKCNTLTHTGLTALFPGLPG